MVIIIFGNIVRQADDRLMLITKSKLHENVNCSEIVSHLFLFRLLCSIAFFYEWFAKKKTQ